MTTGRNAPCPCGSGLKYKRCCLNKAQQPAWRSRLAVAAVGLVLAGGLALVIVSLVGGDSDTGRERVWSEEHQHWHYIE